MVSSFYTAILAALPAAIAVLPAFIAMPIAAIMVKLALRALPVAGEPREAIHRTASLLQNFSFTCLALFFLTLFATANLAAFESQRTFDASLGQMRR